MRRRFSDATRNHNFLESRNFVIVQTAINFGNFLIMSREILQFAEIEEVLYVTDGTRTWEMKEVAPPDTKES